MKSTFNKALSLALIASIVASPVVAGMKPEQARAQAARLAEAFKLL